MSMDEVTFTRGPARRPIPRVSDPLLQWATGLQTKERRIYAGSDEVQSKPEQAREKIVEGMVNKRFFAAYPGGVLLEQPWIHDTGKTVAQALEEEGMRVLAFERFDVAE